MHSGETAASVGTAAGVICFHDLGSRTEQGKRHRRIRSADDKFSALGGKEQIGVLCHAIGYLEASKDLIASGKQARTDEVSRIFGMLEELINESWNGGMI